MSVLTHHPAMSGHDLHLDDWLEGAQRVGSDMQESELGEQNEL